MIRAGLSLLTKMAEVPALVSQLRRLFGMNPLRGTTAWPHGAKAKPRALHVGLHIYAI